VDIRRLQAKKMAGIARHSSFARQRLRRSSHLVLLGVTLGLGAGGEGGIASAMSDHRLAETAADSPEIRELLLSEIGIALTHEFHRLIKPLILLLRRCLEHTTSVDVAEQFVSSVIEIGFLMRTQRLPLLGSEKDKPRWTAERSRRAVRPIPVVLGRLAS
jgi:hypothetical protein